MTAFQILSLLPLCTFYRYAAKKHFWKKRLVRRMLHIKRGQGVTSEGKRKTVVTDIMLEAVREAGASNASFTELAREIHAIPY